MQADPGAKAAVFVQVLEAAKLGGAKNVSIAMPRKVEPAVDASELDRKPRATHQPQPKLAAALRAKVPATVKLLLVVDSKGRVGDVRVRESSDAAFETSAIAAARTWRFQPGTVDGVATAFRTSVTITFPKD